MEHTHKVSVAAMVHDGNGRILLVNSPWRGWEYPGGLIEPGESFEAALRREIREESGVEVEIERFVGIFVCRYVSGELTTSEESTEVVWVTPEQAFAMITFPLTKKRLENMLAMDGKAHFFGFTRDPFGVVENFDLPVGE